jgi:hypothetical protein
MDFKGKDASTVFYELEKPLTMVGFDNYVFSKKIIVTLKDYFANLNEAYSEYSHICSRIRNEIREDQITGGILSFYNASITQRLNNLVEKVETKVENIEVNFED